ncbi:hypothetical protein [Sessilibacter sp. MAH2]
MNESIIKRYWKSYGGFKALFRSYYFYGAIFISLILAPHWLNSEWWKHVLSIMPSVLGFSLGGYAMWIALGDENFRKLISGGSESGGPSPFMSVNAAFVHFILLQILAILSALFADAYNFTLPKDSCILKIFGHYFYYICKFGAFLGYFIFIYALLSAVAATLSLLRVSSWYDEFMKGK